MLEPGLKGLGSAFLDLLPKKMEESGMGEGAAPSWWRCCCVVSLGRNLDKYQKTMGRRRKEHYLSGSVELDCGPLTAPSVDARCLTWKHCYQLLTWVYLLCFHCYWNA